MWLSGGGEEQQEGGRNHYESGIFNSGKHQSSCNSHKLNKTSHSYCGKGGRVKLALFREGSKGNTMPNARGI